MDDDKELESPKPKIELTISVKTIAKVLVVCGLAYLGILLFPLILTLFLSVMLAVSLNPFLLYLHRKGVPPWIGITIVTMGIMTIIAALLFVVMPSIIEQTSSLIVNLPNLQNALLRHLEHNETLKIVGEKALKQLAFPDPAKVLSPLATAGQIAIGGITELGLVLIFTVYLLADGQRAISWILAFFSSEVRAKMQTTASEMSKIISAYVLAQVITSMICGIYTFIALTILNVPEPLMLAAIAAAFDVLPVLGFFLAGIPAVILGFSMSAFTGLAVIALYVAYHAVESYLLIPKIYGSHMRVSDLVVLISLIVAGALGGVLGALAILPLVASYPIVEKIWLSDLLGRGVIRKHESRSNLII